MTLVRDTTCSGALAVGGLASAALGAAAAGGAAGAVHGDSGGGLTDASRWVTFYTLRIASPRRLCYSDRSQLQRQNAAEVTAFVHRRPNGWRQVGIDE